MVEKPIVIVRGSDNLDEFSADLIERDPKDLSILKVVEQSQMN